MHVGRDVNGLYGLGAQRDAGQTIDRIADTFKRVADPGYAPSRVDDWTSFLDQRYSVKQVLFFGVLGYVGYKALSKWRGW